MESPQYYNAPAGVNGNGTDMRCGARHWGGGASCPSLSRGHAMQSATLTTIDTMGSLAPIFTVESLASWQGDDGTRGTLPTLESLPAWQEDPPQLDGDSEDEAAYDTDDEFDHPRVHYKVRCQGDEFDHPRVHYKVRCQGTSFTSDSCAPTWASEGGAWSPCNQQVPAAPPGNFTAAGVTTAGTQRQAPAASGPWRQAAPAADSRDPPQPPTVYWEAPPPRAPAAPQVRDGVPWPGHGVPFARGHCGGKQAAPAADYWEAPPADYWEAPPPRAPAQRGGDGALGPRRAHCGGTQAAGSANAAAAGSPAPGDETVLTLVPPSVPNDPADLHRGQQGEWLPRVVTVMISGIPIDVKQGGLLDLIERTGFRRRFDYAYLPRNFHTGTSQGHAFVNFVTPSDADNFYSMWNRSQLVGARLDVAELKIRASLVQGFEENTKSWTASRLRRVRNPEFRAFIADGLCAAAP